MYDLGIDKSEFNPEKAVPCDNLLYYGDGKITDTYYLRNVYVYDKEFTNQGEHEIFVVGEVKTGTYLTTCMYNGVAQATVNQTAAFAIATSNSVLPIDKPMDMVQRVNAKFL